MLSIIQKAHTLCLVQLLQLKNPTRPRDKKIKDKIGKLPLIRGTFQAVIEGDLIWHPDTSVLGKIGKEFRLHLEVGKLHLDTSKGDSVPELVSHLARPR